MTDKTKNTLEKKLSFIRKVVNLGKKLGLSPADAREALAMAQTELVPNPPAQPPVQG